MCLRVLCLTVLTVSMTASSRVRSFGRTESGEEVELYTLKTGDVEVDILTYGSTLAALRLPDKKGSVADVALGFDTLQGYTASTNQYLGATIGRVANRIAGGSFMLDGVRYNISKNLGGEHTLHGGLRGLDKKVWKTRIENGSLVMCTVSPDGEDGFPGELKVQAKYTLTPDFRLIIQYTATTNKRTPVNIVNHVYLNLAGEGTGSKGLYQHEVKVKSDRYTELTADWKTPTGKLLPVEGTPYDLREAKNLGEAIAQTADNGFDINYEIAGSGLREVALVRHACTGRLLKVMSDQPGVQFYTSNFLGGVRGKGGQVYEKHGAFCLETQGFPDAVNHHQFPSTILSPGETYRHTLVFEFHTCH